MDGMMQVSEMTEDVPATGEIPRGWQLKKLSERHKSICTLLAQGLPRRDVATMTDVHPNYITALLQQPLIIGYIKEMATVSGVQLQAITELRNEAISTILQTGNGTEKLKAARLQAELVGDVGSRGSLNSGLNPAEDRLLKLADRLISLLSHARGVSDNEEITDASFTEVQPEQ